MFHHEFVVNNHAIWVKGEISKLEAFASICPIPADQFMVSAFAMNFPTALGVTSSPPSRTPYTHDVRIFYISSLSMLFDICEQCWYQRCVTSIEIGGDVLALGIRFI